MRVYACECVIFPCLQDDAHEHPCQCLEEHQLHQEARQMSGAVQAMFQGHCFLTEMMKHGYIVEFEIIDDHRAGKIVMNHTYRLNSFVMCT